MYDTIIIGSGFGGAFTARQLVKAGQKVLMLERGGKVNRGPENWEMSGSLELTEFYDKSTPLKVVKGGHKKVMGLYTNVGGPSVWYGGVSFRFREKDFEPNADVEGSDPKGWPFKYADLESYYTEAEQILQISGEAGVDPTEPPRSAPFPQGKPPLAKISQKVKSGAEKLGYRPFQLPLAINYEDKSNGRKTCQHCTTCDTFACAVSAKNDLATMVVPNLIRDGMELRSNMVVTKILTENTAVSGVEATDKLTGEKHVFKAKRIVLAAGALGSPHLLLSSRLESMNPGGHVVGRNLMRHVNCIIFGIFPGVADKEGRFHKQLGILDLYNGYDGAPVKGKLGSLQQIPTPPMGLVQNEIPGPLGKLLSQGVRLLTGLLAIAEDQPQIKNGMVLDWSKKDKYGLPQPIISHEYSERDLAALKALISPAKKIMRKAGAVAHYVHHIRTFSHAVGTVRMGTDPLTSALDENCQFRGVDNLYVVDGSFMPTSAAVNPSLTIAANALRVGKWIVENEEKVRGASSAEFYQATIHLSSPEANDLRLKEKYEGRVNFNKQVSEMFVQYDLVLSPNESDNVNLYWGKEYFYGLKKPTGIEHYNGANIRYFHQVQKVLSDIIDEHGLRGIDVTIKNINYHPVDSKLIAFELSLKNKFSELKEEGIFTSKTS